MKIRLDEMVNGSVDPVRSDEPTKSAWKRMLAMHVKALPVVDASHGRVIGAVLLDRLMEGASDLGGQTLQRPVRDFMTSRISFVSDELTELNLNRLADQNVECVVMQDAGGRLTGIISLKSIQQASSPDSIAGSADRDVAGSTGDGLGSTEENPEADVDPDLWNEIVDLARNSPPTR